MKKCLGRVVMLAALVVVCGLTVAGQPLAADREDDRNADACFRKEDYATAKVLYEQYWNLKGGINRTPGQQVWNAEVLLRLGKCCLRLRQFEEARTWYRKLIEKYPSDIDRCSGALYRIAISYLKQNSRSAAFETFEKLLADYPHERGMGSRTLLKMTDVDMKSKRYDDAIKTIQRLCAQYPDRKNDCKWSRFLLAEAYDQTFRTDESLGVLNALYSDPESNTEQKGEALVRIAGVQLHGMRYIDAKETCQKILTDYAGSEQFEPRAKMVLIQALCEDGTDPDTALSLIEEMRKVPQYGHVSRQAQLTLWEGGCYWIKADYARAEATYTRLMNEYADQPAMASDAHFHRARVRIHGLHAYDEAAYDIAKIDVPNLQHYARGDWYYSQGDHTRAAAEYEQVIEKLPDDCVSSTEPTSAFKRLELCYSKLGDEAKSNDAGHRLAQFKAARNLTSEVQR